MHLFFHWGNIQLRLSLAEVFLRDLQTNIHLAVKESLSFASLHLFA